MWSAGFYGRKSSRMSCLYLAHGLTEQYVFSVLIAYPSKDQSFALSPNLYLRIKSR